jgi:hypothetical protein
MIFKKMIGIHETLEEKTWYSELIFINVVPFSARTKKFSEIFLPLFIKFFTP